MQLITFLLHRGISALNTARTSTERLAFPHNIRRNNIKREQNVTNVIAERRRYGPDF